MKETLRTDQAELPNPPETKNERFWRRGAYAVASILVVSFGLNVAQMMGWVGEQQVTRPFASCGNEDINGTNYTCTSAAYACGNTLAVYDPACRDRVFRELEQSSPFSVYGMNDCQTTLLTCDEFLGRVRAECPIMPDDEEGGMIENPEEEQLLPPATPPRRRRLKPRPTEQHSQDNDRTIISGI